MPEFRIPNRFPHGLHRRGTNCRIEAPEQCLVSEILDQTWSEAEPEKVKFDIRILVFPFSVSAVNDFGFRRMHLQTAHQGCVPLPFEPEGQRGTDIIGALPSNARSSGCGGWLRQLKQAENALQCFRRAIDRGLPDHLLFPTLWDIAILEKKLEPNTSIASFTELAGSRNPFRAAALEELAKHYEHRERDYAAALQVTQRAQQMEDNPGLQYRAERLERRLKRQALSSKPALCPPRGGSKWESAIAKGSFVYGSGTTARALTRTCSMDTGQGTGDCAACANAPNLWAPTSISGVNAILVRKSS